MAARLLKVLVMPGGTEIGLEIFSALSECKDVELYSAGIEVSNHAPYLFARHDFHPGVAHAEWLPELNRIIRQRGIDFVIPAHDDVVIACAQRREEILATVLCCPLETCVVTRLKSATYRCFKGLLNIPSVYHDAGQIPSYPVFVKPDRGQGSKGAKIVYSREELNEINPWRNGLLVLEYLPGEEFTVDCFTDRERGLLFCAGRRRERIRAGISVATQGVVDERFRKIAEVLSCKLTFHGAWFFQLKKNDAGELKLLEIAPRIAGTMAYHRVLGVNFPLLSLYEALRMPVEIMTNDIAIKLDRAFINRYAIDLIVKNVYVDLDDTLLVHQKVSLSVIRFLYQCLNGGARLTLITRHRGDLNKTLHQRRLHGLFDRIIHLAPDELKSKAIDDRHGAIMIDDSFSERAEVARNTGILTFDNSMLELLQDYRL